MKKVLFLAILATVSISTFAQSYSVTPDGLKDATNSEKSFLVINAEGKTSKQLYDNAVLYVNATYKNPNAVMRGNVNGEFLSFVTHQNFYYSDGIAKHLFDIDYLTSLTFKDGKVKYEIEELKMVVPENKMNIQFTGGTFQYSIYKKDGSVRKDEIKNYLETSFNTNVSLLKTYLEGKSSIAKKDDF